MLLETITGNLRNGYKQLHPGTMLHVDELMKERRDNTELRSQCFYTADGEVYFLDGAKKTPTLAITRKAKNPVLRNIKDAFEQLTQKPNIYRPSQADFQHAIAARDTVLVALPTLHLQDDGVGWQYLEIRTEDGFIKNGNKYETPQKGEQKVMKRLGYTSKNLAMLRKSPQQIREIKLYFPNQDYIQKHTEEGAFAMPSLLGDFNNGSVFYAGGNNLNHHICVRGLRRVICKWEERIITLAERLGPYDAGFLRKEDSKDLFIRRRYW